MKSSFPRQRVTIRHIEASLRAAPLCLALACSPTPAEPLLLDKGARSSLTITFDDSPLDGPQGSVAQLSGFDNISLLSFSTSKGAMIAAFDGSTVFRSANVNQFAPVDPCRAYAINYNTAAPTGDASGLFAAISEMATNGCLARIHVDRTQPVPPPIKSFRPLPGL
jgi:hypothetical protein